MANGLDRFNKKWGSSIKRTKKETRKAAESHIIKETTEKRIATESLEDKMKRTGVTNFETNEVVPYNTVNEDDSVWGFINKSFYNKLTNDMKNEAEEIVMNNLETVLNKVLDAREARNRELDLAIAEQTTQQMKIVLEQKKVELEMLRLQAVTKSTPVEFEMDSFMSPKKSIKERANELGIDWDEVQRKSKIVQDFVYVADKEPLPKREAVVKVAVQTPEEIQAELEAELAINPVVESSVRDGWSVPIRKTRSGYSVAWKQVIEDDRFLSVVHGIIAWANDNGVNIRDTNAFRKFHPVCQGTYVQCTKVYPGKGSWNSILVRFGL